MDFWWLKRPSSWNLQRNPLVPSVPLEGTDTVRGLSTLERMRTADLIVSNHKYTPKKENVGVRRRYQRYKGPFIEYLGLEDVKRDAKSWREFGGQESSKVPRGGGSFSIPASLDLLAERVDVRGDQEHVAWVALLTLISCLQENIVYYFGNYMRLFLCILVLMTYLRPKSIVGIAVLGYNMYSNYERALQASGGMQREEEDRSADLGSSNKTILIAALTWVVMVYSKCMPILLLAMMVSLVAIIVHAAIRASASECRYRGKKVISYSFKDVWRGDGGDSQRIYREIFLVCRQSCMQGYRWALYYGLVWRDRLLQVCSRVYRGKNESWK